MTAKRQCEDRGRTGVFILICVVTVILYSSYLFADEQSGTSRAGVGTGPARYRVEVLKHISAEQGRKYLAQVKIGTVSRLPSPNTLLITAKSRELIKASAILNLVDAEKEFVIKAIFPASEANDLPSNDDIAAKVGNMLIGTFFNPPSGEAKSKAIIDIHNDSVIVIAPAGQLEKIIAAIEQLQEAKAKAVRLVEPNQPEEPKADVNESEPDELFDKLLGSLAEVEKSHLLQKTHKTEIQQLRTPEPVPQDTNEPNLPAAVKDTEVKDVVKEPKAEPKVEVRQPAVAAEKPTVAKVTPVRSYKPQSIALAEEELELDLPEKLDIVLLLDLVHKHLDLDLMYDPEVVKGDVALRVQGPIKVKELYPMLESVLKFKGFVMARKGNLVTVVRADSVMDIDPALLTREKGQVEYGDVMVTRTFRLEHIDTASATNLLTGMKLGVNITPISETGTLIVTGYAYRMGRIEELLQIIDQPGKPKKFRFRQLKYTMAEALAPKIKALAEQLGTVSITIAAPRAPTPTPTKRTRARPAPQRKQPAAVPKTTKPTVYLDADERTNRILMIGLEEQLAIVDELINALDVEQQDLRTLRSYDIQNVGAEEVREKLVELGIIGGEVGRTTPARSRTQPRRTASKSKAAKPATTGAAIKALTEEPQVVIIEATNSLLVNATAEQHIRIATIIGYVDSEQEKAAIPYKVYPLENQDPEKLATLLNKLVLETTTKQDKGAKIQKTTKKRLEEDIVILSDPETYSLIVYASKKNQLWISSLITALDEYRPQVLLDVTLVQITKDDAFNFDLDLLSSIPDLVYTSGHTVGSAEQAIVDKLLSATDRNKFIDMKSEGGTFTGFYGDEKINALLTAIQTKKYGRVMARPKLLVNDNQEGSIKTTDTTYIKKVEHNWTTGDNPVQTETVSYPSYPAGITLNIKPHISTGDMLRLEITLNRSGFTEVPTGEKPPDKADADVTTTVTVPNKSTIILGGMEKIEHSKGGAKVPFLGDLPLIGGAFRKVAKSGGHDKLYIFVKAHILRPGGDLALADLKEVSHHNRETFEKLETEMQKYKTWPGIKPEPMDPVKVLEAD